MAARPQNTSSKTGRAFMLFIGVVTIIVVAAIMMRSSTDQDTNDTGNNNDNMTAVEVEAVGGADLTAEQEIEEAANAATNEIQIEAVAATIAQHGFWLPSITSMATTQIGDTKTYSFGAQNVISVMPAASENVVRSSVSNLQEKEIIVDGRRALELSGVSQKDGAPITYLLIYKEDEIYFTRGDGAFLEEVKTQMQL